MKRLRLLTTVVLAGGVFVAASASAEQTTPRKTLYERLGGMTGITVVVDDFIDRLVIDHVLNMNPRIKEARSRVPAPHLKYHVSALVCQVTGGPCAYTGRTMKDSHAHLNITPAEWDWMVAVFKDVLADHRVPPAEQQELLDIVGSTRADIVMASAASPR
ncbi:MAG TPA: group 1 truncated hemoglobin [Thermoanaerobaculaceae bacterium]|nr:group 1 truncated hemoglobin [Thermoanaerobaculaceae bacterium]